MAMIAVQLLIGIGGMLLTALFTPKPRDQWGSRLSNINVPSVTPGQVIPRVWGTMKIPATMIFASPLIETMHTHQASKKGGGKGMFGGNSAKNYSFTYSIDAAWAVCLGPVFRINRIWANQKLLYVDPQVTATASSDFEAAYQAEATRLIDEEGVQLDYAASSAFVFAFNNYGTGEVTLSSPTDAVDYITGHPIDDTAGITGQVLTPNRDKVVAIIDQLYSGLNNANTYLSQINRFDQIEIYLGTDNQVPNSLLEGYLGLGNTPGFRNCAYFVITNMQLMDFGNSVPSLTVEVQRTPNGKTDLVQVMTDICYQAGLTDGQFDAISNLDATPFPGFAVTSNQSAREAVAELQKAFPIDAAETGYKIVFNMLNARALQIIDPNDLAAHVDTEAVPSRQEVTVMSDYDLPQRINLRFQEPARSYSPNALYAARYNTPSQMIEDLDVTIALDRSTAQTSVQNLLGHRMLARRTYKWALPRKYVTLEPTDPFRIRNKLDPTRFDQFYCTQVDVGANGVIKIEAVDHVYVDPSLKPTDQVADDLQAATAGNTTLPSTSQTRAYLLDVPLLFDNDADKPGYYVVMAGMFHSWGGGTLFVDAASPSVATAYGFTITTPTAGSAWESIASSQFNIPHGVVLNQLSPGLHSCYWDRLSVITVRIYNGMTLQSAAEEDMLTQSLNATVIGNEIVQYANAVDLGNGLWRLSDFLRGQRGTERYIDSHVAGERFVRLTSATQRVITSKADIGYTDSFRSITVGQEASTAQTFTFTDTGAGVKPRTPHVYLKTRIVGSGTYGIGDIANHRSEALPDGSSPSTVVAGDVIVGWWPRVRQNGQWLSGSEVTLPANDSPETYEVAICTGPDPATEIKKYTLTGSSVNYGGVFVYPAAQQAADLGSAPATVYMVIYQISTIVGRGFGIGVAV